MLNDKIPLNKALVWILLSTIVVSGSFAMAWLYYLHLRQLRMHDDQYRVSIVVQQGPDKEALHTLYLTELLDLSVDRPTNLYRFDTKGAERKLLASPLIKKAVVKKVLPGTVVVDYVARKPIAFLGDYTNTAIDIEGHLFPFTPFFTPKNLPVVYFGAFDFGGESLWGKRLDGPKGKLAITLLQAVTQSCCSEATHLKQINVSRAYADSYGDREIVIAIEHVVEDSSEGKARLVAMPKLLRLSTDTYLKQLGNYLVLRDYLLEEEAREFVTSKEMVIDLRIPQLAFIKQGED